MRRLPVFFVIDCSESMVGKPLEAVQEGIDFIMKSLRTDPYALETVYVSVIAYAGIVRTLVPLTELFTYRLCELPLGGGTHLGKALDHLGKEIDRSVMCTTADFKGDWKPIVYLFTDGRPTDDYQEAIDRWKVKYEEKVSLVAIGLGQDVDFTILKQFAEHCIMLDQVDQAYVKSLCKWISASVVSQSISVGHQNENQDLLPFDERYMHLAKSKLSFRKGRADDRTVTFVGRCQKLHHPYILKYTRNMQYDGLSDLNISLYNFKLETCKAISEDYFSWTDQTADKPTINTAELEGDAQCPHCYAETAFAMCGCGNLMCYDGYSESVVCPWCHRQVSFTISNGSFDLTRGQG